MANYLSNDGPMLSEDRREMTPARSKMIQEHRKWADSRNDKLPYEIGIFGSKIGKKPRNIVFDCECGKTLYVTKLTCAVICSSCGKLNTVNLT
jgi:hypothetical protein